MIDFKLSGVLVPDGQMEWQTDIGGCRQVYYEEGRQIDITYTPYLDLYSFASKYMVKWSMVKWKEYLLILEVLLWQKMFISPF